MEKPKKPKARKKYKKRHRGEVCDAKYEKIN